MQWTRPEFWHNASPRETLETFRRISKSKLFKGWNLYLEKHQALADLVFEYVWLYRSEPIVKEMLNHMEFPPWLLLRFVYFGFGKQFQCGKFDSNEYFTELKDLLGSETSLRILSLSSEIEKDPTLKIHLLANLDPATWESYFESLDEANMTMEALLGIFANLRDFEIKKILLTSPTLYMYLRMMMLSSSQKVHPDSKLAELFRSLREILDSILVWEKLAESIQQEFRLAEERQKPPAKRQEKRLNLLLRKLKETSREEEPHILQYLVGLGVILDSWEESTLRSSLVHFRTHGKLV